MTTYDYRDDKHYMICTFPIGTAPREIDCPKCKQPMKLVIGAGVNIAPSSLENKGWEVRATKELDQQIDVDRAAYRRMVKERGLQPPHVSGSAAMENEVGDQMDIDYGHMYPRVPKAELKESLERNELAKLGLLE